MPFIELLNKYEKEKKLNGTYNQEYLQADVLAYQGKFNEAGALLEKAGRAEKAIEMFSELRKWKEAKEIALRSGKDVGKLVGEQAGIAAFGGDWMTAADLYYTSKQYKKAVELYGNHGRMDKLIEVCRSLDKSEDEEAIRLCAHYFKKNGNHQYAKEAYLKLGDMKSLMLSHIELCKWEEAFIMAKNYPEFDSLIHLPYAEWLEKNDRFEEAQREYKLGKRPELSMRIIEKLCKNAIVEQRFKDAAYFYWLLSLETLQLVKNAKNPDFEDTKRLQNFHEYNLLADIYYAYNSVHSFIEEPFQHTGRVYQQRVFNACRFILGKMGTRSPLGVTNEISFI